MHPDTKIIIHWVGVHGNKFSVSTTVEHFKTCAIEILESKIVDNIEQVFYTINNETHTLDYYNAIL